MKSYILLAVLLTAAFVSHGEDIKNPQDHYLSDYHAGDFVKQFSIDFNHDGVADELFTTIEANPDPTTKISNDQRNGSMSWDIYVSNPGSNTFKICKDIEIDGKITQGAGIDIDPNLMFVGKISEIKQYGIVTLEVMRSRSENSTIIYAYTWERNHIKRWKLAVYLESQKNAIFDKYLKEDKRTKVTVRQIKP